MPKLSDAEVRNAQPKDKPYKLFDEKGLFLLIKPNGAMYWRLRYATPDGKENVAGLGVYRKPMVEGKDSKPKLSTPKMGLAEARDKRDKALDRLKEGKAASEKQQARKEAAAADAQVAIQQAVQEAHRFTKVANDWHARQTKWTPSHAERVWRSLELHALPQLGERDITTLKTGDILAVLRPIEAAGTLDVAQRVAQRIHGVMRFAVQSGLIDSNPAVDVQGAIKPPEGKHRPALPLDQLPELLARFDGYQGRNITKLMLQLSLLTFARSSELRFARWPEFDLDNALWTMPGEREPVPGVKFSQRGAKMKTTHLIPLARQAVALLRELHGYSKGLPFIFPGDHDPAKPPSENTVNHALRLMGYDTQADQCLHGFRTLACSTLYEAGRWPGDAIERQMSHVERDGVKAAYVHRAAYMSERREMMQWWADYLDELRAGRFVRASEYGEALARNNGKPS